ncbi:MAG: putative signal transducing protein [Flavobacteriales bacterium]
MPWVKIYEDRMMQNIAMVRHTLDEAEIEHNTINNISNLYPTLGEIEIYVQDRDVIKAKQLIDKLMDDHE